MYLLRVGDGWFLVCGIWGVWLRYLLKSCWVDLWNWFFWLGCGSLVILEYLWINGKRIGGFFFFLLVCLFEIIVGLVLWLFIKFCWNIDEWFF